MMVPGDIAPPTQPSQKGCVEAARDKGKGPNEARMEQHSSTPAKTILPPLLIATPRTKMAVYLYEQCERKNTLGYSPASTMTESSASGIEQSPTSRTVQDTQLDFSKSKAEGAESSDESDSPHQNQRRMRKIRVDSNSPHRYHRILKTTNDVGQRTKDLIGVLKDDKEDELEDEETRDEDDTEAVSDDEGEGLNEYTRAKHAEVVENCSEEKKRWKP